MEGKNTNVIAAEIERNKRTDTRLRYRAYMGIMGKLKRKAEMEKAKKGGVKV